jgi:hypothetical protein
MTPSLLKPRLRARGGIPYGGEFKLNLPDLGFVGSGTTFDMLMTNIRKWRFANGLANGLGLEEEVERELCKLYPAECVETDSRVPQRETLDVSAVIQGTKVMARHKLSGLPLVSQEEADRRAAVCVRCPSNMDFRKPCAGICGELKDLVMSMVGHRTTPHGERLKSCQICACFISAAVWLPLDVQLADLTEEQKAQFQFASDTVGCWKWKPVEPPPSQ